MRKKDKIDYRSEKEKKTITYLIKDTLSEHYKIGKSMYVDMRFRDHSYSNLHLDLIGISPVKEIDLHKKYKEFRVTGEWFKITDKDKEKELINYFIEYNEINEKLVHDNVYEKPFYIKIDNVVDFLGKKKVVTPKIDKKYNDLQRWEVERNERYHQIMKNSGFGKSYSSYH